MSDPITRLNAALEGRYAIDRELGEGGMATVYLADDLKHNRKVAVKVLKPDLAAVVGAERFLAEIETTANLTHPHILPLHDSGEADGFLFYVMPYLDGETLGDRLKRDKQLPVDEAVALATKVAGALQHAHEHGVIHRDIKPANILLQDGEPVVADFGIALALGVAGGTRLTETGLSVGTPFYMSPEQATGDQAVGASTDTYALGSVLYEMLVGEPPYPGATAQAVLGKIIAGEPVSATKQRPAIPPNVDAAVRKALEKLPADRFASAQDFVRALGDEHFRYGELATAAGSADVGPWKRMTMATTTLAALFAAAFAWSFLQPEPPRPVTRVSVDFPQDQRVVGLFGGFDMSQDGSLLVYEGPGATGEGSQLWARRWAALEATPIQDTEGALLPAISPDGLEVAYADAGSIRVVPIQGGIPRTVAPDSVRCCVRWGPDGAWLYFNNPAQGLSRVPATGGPVEVVTRVDTAAGDAFNIFVDVLPGGEAAVYQAGLGANGRVLAVTIESGEVTELTSGLFPRYSQGYLLFTDLAGTTLLAQPFDAESLELSGAATPIAEGLRSPVQGWTYYAASQTGSLVYSRSEVEGVQGLSAAPMWVERDGTAREIDPGWTVQADTTFSSLALSPDGDRLALSIQDSEGRYDLWVKQLDTEDGPLSRLTFEGVNNIRAAWSRDGQSLTFVSNRAGGGAESYDLWTRRADGSGTPELLLDREEGIWKGLYSADDAWLVFREGANELANVYGIQPGVDSMAVPLVVGEFETRYIALSPNGRWLAHVSNRSGRDEVYVVPFPDAGASLQQVSADGGVEPVWAHNGQELFYRNGANELVAVEVIDDPTFGVGEREVLFSMADYLTSNGHPMYEVSLDDQRFVMLRPEGAVDSELILFQNFFEELRRLVAN